MQRQGRVALCRAGELVYVNSMIAHATSMAVLRSRSYDGSRFGLSERHV
jgi:hypothetical protein